MDPVRGVDQERDDDVEPSGRLGREAGHASA